MLKLGRKEGERIQIGENIFVTVVRIDGNRVTIGVDVPLEFQIKRLDAKAAERKGYGEVKK